MGLEFLKDVETFGIIGTAGRNTDNNKLSSEVYDKMYKIAEEIIGPKEVQLISGGAAWADHIAVRLFHYSPFHHKLFLELPCKFTNGRYETVDYYDRMNVGHISNHYHTQFSKRINRLTLLEIQEAIDTGAHVSIGKGFFDRNFKVAKADKLIAFTYGDGPRLKDGGTAHTAKAYLANGGKDLYHINLNDFSIHHLSSWPA